MKKSGKDIPDHLREFIDNQDPTQYQPVDHAVWRYLLRQLKSFLSTHAHSCYLEGLEKTGITVEEIPSIQSISKKLQEFGWMAVPVSGFIPPAAFMELQSLGILPIASEMRSLEHILYTPAPDIVHEAAGHAPILVNSDFAKYLRQYATVAKKAIVSDQDLALYEAIRELSDIKEHPNSSQEEILAATEKLNRITESMTVTSEAALLGRMNWWTAEYGLIGSINHPKIYGAGLLSSLGEAKSCLKDHVKKIPLSVDCVTYTYDITEPQPQLFVVESFSGLTRVLNELSMELSFKKGGVFGLNQAIEAKTVNTIQLNSGLQISGQVTELIANENEECIFFKLQGPTQLSVGQRELSGHNKEYHSHGYSSPLGLIKGYPNCLSWASEKDLRDVNLIQGQRTELQFESGIVLKGKLTNTFRTPRRELCLLSFDECTLTYRDKTLFMPEWGTFDMAVGSKIESVFSGPADRKSYGLTDRFPKKKVPPKQLSPQDQKLNQIYKGIRSLRQRNIYDPDEIKHFFDSLEKEFPADWLARVELVELSSQKNKDSNRDQIQQHPSHQKEETEKLRKLIVESLERVKEEQPDKTGMIEDGLALSHQSL